MAELVKRVTNRHFRLKLVCEHCMRPVGDGYQVEKREEWTVKLLPALQVICCTAATCHTVLVVSRIVAQLLIACHASGCLAQLIFIGDVLGRRSWLGLHVVVHNQHVLMCTPPHQDLSHPCPAPLTSQVSFQLARAYNLAAGVGRFVFPVLPAIPPDLMDAGETEVIPGKTLPLQYLECSRT